MSSNLIWKKGPWHGDIRGHGIVEHYTGTARNDGTQWHVLLETACVRGFRFIVMPSDYDGLPGSTMLPGYFESKAAAMSAAETHEAARVAAKRRKAAMRAARAMFWNSYRYGATS